MKKMTLLVLLFSSCLCNAQQLKEEKLLSPETKFSVPIIMHRMSVWNTGRLSRNCLFCFADETLYPPDMTLVQELDKIKAAGASSVVIEKGMELYADNENIRNCGMKIVLMGNMSKLILRAWDASPEKWQNVVPYFISLLEYAKKYPQLFYHENGRPVLWIFAAKNFPPEKYTLIKQKLKEKGYDPLIYFQAIVITMRNQKTVTEYMKHFDGIFIWGGGYDMTCRMLGYAKKARAEILKQTGQKKGIILTSKAGHWRKEKGSMIISRGTGEFRHTMELAWKAKAQGLIIESWNDFSENHNIEPSFKNSYVFYDLCKYYGAIGKKNTFYAEDPGIYLSSRREILKHENYDLELLKLPVKQAAPKNVRIIVKNENGKVVYKTKLFQLKSNDARAYTLSLTPATFKDNKVLIPYIEINGGEIYTSIFTPVRQNWLTHPFSYHISLAKSFVPESEQFSISKQLEASFSIKNAKKIKRLEIVKNYKPVYEPAYQRKLENAGVNINKLKIICVRWDLPYNLNKFRVAGKKMTLTAHNAKIDDAFLCFRDKTAQIVHRDFPHSLSWTLQKQGMHNELQLAVEAEKDAYFEIAYPFLNKKVKFSLKEIQKNKVTEFLLHDIMALKVYCRDKPVGFPLELGLAAVAGKTKLAKIADAGENIYFLRAVDYDNRIYRSRPVFIPSDNYKGRQCVELDFSTKGRIMNDTSAYSFDGELGGAFERDGRFDKSQIPQRKNGKLFFDGNDFIQIRPDLIPRGGYRISIGVTPTAFGENKARTLVSSDPLKIAVLPTGKVTVRCCSYSAKKVYKLSSKMALEKNRHYLIEVVNDLKRLTIFVDGKKVASRKIDYRPLYKTIPHTSIGADVNRGKHMSGGKNGFIGYIDFFKVQALSNNYTKNGCK